MIPTWGLSPDGLVSAADPQTLHQIAVVLWLCANVALGIASLAVLFYCSWVFFLTKWREYAAGRAVLQFVFSLLLVVGLVIYGLFDNDSYLSYPPVPVEPQIGRVVLRLLIYGFVAYATVRLDVLLVQVYIRGTRPRPESGVGRPFFPPEDTARLRRVRRR